ncbi:hypothetical protein RQP46_007770 [Phenoliferia psychrophenolica]
MHVGHTEETPIILDPTVEELWSSRALLIVLLLLILSFWVSYYLKVRRIRSIHETIVALFAGMAVGLLVRLAPGNVVQDMISFKSTILLNVLLPPIILNSGYQLKQENFFRNFGVILTFAFAGTFISAVVLGVIVYLYSLLGLEGLSLTIIECLLFGSTLSATDPVTILAIFNALNVDPKLYSIIFGESILNDAVAIVMFETLSQFHGEKIHVLSFFHGTGIFLLTFCISMALGVIFGLSCSLMLKHSELGRYTEIESCLVFLIAYTSYFFSNALTMSGIVSLLFCGITLKHYAYHNMSQRTQRTSRYMFGILAQLSENFIFIYLGLSLFTQTKLVYKPMFILVTAFAVCVARYCAVFPISKVINMTFKARGQRSDELPHSYQMMLFWAGLRGAVGVALAVGMKGENAIALRTTVLVCVVLTVVVFGGTIGRMIEILGIRTGVEEEDDSSDEEGGYQLAGGEVDVESRPNSRSKRRSGKFTMPMDLDRDRAEGTISPADSPYRDRDNQGRVRSRPTTPGGGKVRGGGLMHSTSSSSVTGHGESSETSEDSDPDVLPAATDASGVTEKEGDLTRVWRDGQWFTVLDERYLLPVFSNATASRRQASKKALLRAKRHSFAVDATGHHHDDAFESGEPPSASVPGSPYLNSAQSKSHREFTGSFSDIISSLVSSGPSPLPSPSAHKRRGSNDDDEMAVGGSTIDLNLTALGHEGRPGVRPRGSISGVSAASGTTTASPQLGGAGQPVLAFGGPNATKRQTVARTTGFVAAFLAIGAPIIYVSYCETVRHAELRRRRARFELRRDARRAKRVSIVAIEEPTPDGASGADTVPPADSGISSEEEEEAGEEEKQDLRDLFASLSVGGRYANPFPEWREQVGAWEWLAWKLFVQPCTGRFMWDGGVPASASDLAESLPIEVPSYDILFGAAPASESGGSQDEPRAMTDSWDHLSQPALSDPNSLSSSTEALLPPSPSTSSNPSHPSSHQRAIRIGSDVTLTWLGQSTSFVQLDGVGILTDPVFTFKTLDSFLAPPRLCPCPCALSDLLSIQVVLVSHSHLDHISPEVPRALGSTVDWVVPRGMRPWFRSLGVSDDKIHDLDWWESVQLDSLWCSYVVKGIKDSYFHCGDTGFSEGLFHAIGRIFPGITLATLPIGAYSPRWHLAPVHMSPDDAVKAHKSIGAKLSVGVHHSTWCLSDEHYLAPPLDLAIARKEHGLQETDFCVVPQGRTLVL